ncbi:MAG: hypothetical protein UW86_C0002G0039 [Microgenomates group bacterium GW2011_GWA1_Microgenomates_45_10]|nr:MAG: hypothetical protein UW69_C0016G0009 [Microgenomates group bacterium GW2011_GWA2_44_7]KKT78098.1 MAG: hypothetical protein UW73_C0007G0039 [Microgenomates group bacterium GW2011_GWB1_44_8]KKT87435.1 MAG: hypothetical protein UW86_C0002G0039 [Microgenomates group bacterium GW2011_GWA1_Microgenomates_45_10]
MMRWEFAATIILIFTLMSKINARWHSANKMPINPTLDQRIKWHLEHARNYPCRLLGGKILEEIKKRGLTV